MSRFYFDITDAAGTEFDKDGMDFPDFDSARAEAMSTLGDIAKDWMRDCVTGGVVSITIRDRNTALFTARLNIETVAN